MRKIEVNFNGSVYVDPERLDINWREALGKDAFEGIYEHEITEYLKEELEGDPMMLRQVMRAGDVEMSGVYVWPVYDNE